MLRETIFVHIVIVCGISFLELEWQFIYLFILERSGWGELWLWGNLIEDGVCLCGRRVIEESGEVRGTGRQSTLHELFDEADVCVIKCVESEIVGVLFHKALQFIFDLNVGHEAEYQLELLKLHGFNYRSFVCEEATKNQRQNSHQFDQDIQTRTTSIFEGVSYCVSDHSRLVDLSSFLDYLSIDFHHSCFNILLSIVPCSSSIRS